MKTSRIAISAFMATTLVAFATPRLVVSTPSLVPESQIDISLDLPAIPTTELGKTVENTWINIQPPLPGKLIWKAQNLIRFLPSEAPAIGTTYTFSIKNDLRYLDQSAVPAGPFANIATEAFRITAATMPKRWENGFSPSTASWIIVFNDAVDPTAAGNFISFSSSTGQRVAAQLERPKLMDSTYLGAGATTWASRFPGAIKEPRLPETLVPTLLVATPISPLPPGKGWQLSILKGLPNSTRTARTIEDSNYQIGEIEPFKITAIRPHLVVDEPRKVLVQFNEAVTEITPIDFLEKCIEIDPRPENLSARFDGSVIELTGNFNEADQYTATFRPPFTSKNGRDLDGPMTATIEFKHITPYLGFPSEDQAQLAKGIREYRMLTLNLDSAHLRIKRLSGLDLVRAFQGYRNYTGNGHDNETIRPVAPVPYPLIVGETLADLEMPLGNPIDTTKMLTLKWDEILPANQRHATLFMEAVGKKHRDYPTDITPPNSQAIVQLTDIGLAWKLTATEALVYAFSCESGMPLSGVKMEIYGEDAKLLSSSLSDAAGLVKIPRDKVARHLHATLGTDSYLTAFDSGMDAVGLWHFPVRTSYLPPSESSRRAFLFTDRSLYRPGETLRLKGIVRSLRGNEIIPAAASPARLVIVDPTDKEIHTSAVSISENGSFDFSYTLPLGTTGTHRIRLEYPEEIAAAQALEDDWAKQETLMASATFELPLRVEEFRRNAFEITQTLESPAPGAHQISASLSANYYQGQPVASGQVKHFSRIQLENPYPERFPDFLFGNHRVEDWRYWYHYFNYRSDGEDESQQNISQVQGETNLAADGKATLTFNVPKAEFPSAQKIVVQSEVTDANHQTLTSTSSAIVHPASLYVGVSRIDQLVRVGEVLPLKLVATDTVGEPYAGTVKLTATLTREVNSSVKSQNDAGETSTRNERSEEMVETRELTLDPVASAAKGTDFQLTPRSTGLHFLTLRGTDSAGYPFATVVRFHAYGTTEYPWLYEDGIRVKLVAEKKSYKPGETARMLVLSPIEGTALVTLEREKVLRHFQVQLRADQPVVEIPLTADDAPNAFVSILIVKGSEQSSREFKEPQLRLGYCELIVENFHDALKIQLDAPASCRPGDDVTVHGRVTLADGQAAAGAEVTLYAEDEGTLAVMGYETPRPLDYFYQPRNLDLETGTSFSSFIPENPKNLDFKMKGFFVGGGGDLGKLADLMRKNFDPCATWAPALITDAAGKFSHTFKVPDTLTRYRLIAIAHQASRYFGHQEASLIVKKDLMLEPKAPRFANQSDSFDAQVLVQNASAFTGTWDIVFNTGKGPETPACTALGVTQERVTLAPGASTNLIFPTRADNTGEAVLTWQATPVSLKNAELTPELTRSLSDAVETRFPISYPMPLLRQSKLITLNEPGKTIDLRKSLDPALLDGSGEIQLEFSRSPLVEASGSVDFLLHYPYGCIEQTTSSLIPWLAVRDLRSVIPRFARIEEKELRRAIQAGADRLRSMQLPDGSFSYWPGSTESTPWACAYAGMGLILAKEQGATVPDSAIASLQTYLIQSLRGTATEKSASTLEMHCRSLYVLALAGAAQPAYRNGLVERLGELTPDARSLLAASIALEDPGNLSKIAIAKSVLTSESPFTSKDDAWMRYPATEANQLIAFLAIDPMGSEPTRILSRMLGERNPYGHWQTTWVNGWSLLAMANYARTHESHPGPIQLTLGEEAISLSADQSTASRNFALHPDLALNVTADQASCVRVKISAKPRIAPLLPVAKNGLSIDRIYERVLPDGSTKILTEPQVGDLIRVSLRITLPSDQTKYLVIDDPLPALFETVNADFASQKAAVGTRTSQDDWNVSHSELRSDRATFFLDQVWRKGTYTLSYLARCTVSGQATAPPAKVESMYDPENVALSASRVFMTN
jgi:alpha-2-macroglobulin